MEKREKERLKVQYLLKMLPHLLPRRGRKLGITPANKKAWKDLARKIKYELEERFENATTEEIIKDMSFNKKPVVMITPEQYNYTDNDEIADNIIDASSCQKEWIKETRKELLARVSASVCMMEQMFISQNIKVYLQMPFVLNGAIYFSNIYLPDYQIAIETDRKRRNPRSFKGKYKTKHEAFERAYIQVFYITNNEAKDPVFFKNKILPEIIGR